MTRVHRRFLLGNLSVDLWTESGVSRIICHRIFNTSIRFPLARLAATRSQTRAASPNERIPLKLGEIRFYRSVKIKGGNLSFRRLEKFRQGAHVSSLSRRRAVDVDLFSGTSYLSTLFTQQWESGGGGRRRVEISWQREAVKSRAKRRSFIGMKSRLACIIKARERVREELMNVVTEIVSTSVSSLRFLSSLIEFW